MKKFLLLVAAVFACAIGMAAQQTLTVHDGEATNGMVPIQGYWCDNFLKCEFVMPADELQAMKGKDIKQLTWYLNEAPSGGGWGNANFQIFMKEVEETTLSAFTGLEGATVVYEGSLDVVGKTELNIELVNPYSYNGGNLLIGVYNTAKGAYMSASFVGEEVEGACVQGYNGNSVDAVSANQRNFIPKTTFTYEEKAAYAASVMPASLDFGKLNPGVTKDLNVKVKNNGTNAFTPAVTVAAPFSTTYQAAELAAGAEVEISVSFAPTEVGDFTGTLTVDCGQAGEFTVALSGVCSDELELTICDGTSENVYLPIYGFYFDTPNTRSQMIYPADMLADVKGCKITGIKFHLSSAMQLDGGNLEVSLAETENTEYTNGDEGIEGVVTDLTPMLTTPLTSGVTTLEFDFDTPYTYNGGNLALQTLVVEAGNFKSQYFKGTSVEYNAGFYEYTTSWSTTASTGLVKFLPKMTISYIKGQEEPAYYVVGGFNGWDDKNGVEVTEEGATIDVAQQDFNNPEDTAQEFKIITTDADGNLVWLGGVDNNNVGYFMIEDSMLDSPISLDNAGANFRLPEPGNYTIHLAFLEKSTVSGLIMFVTKNQVTGVNGIADKTVAGVKYYNLTGIESSKPFNGINIVVTTYSDGTISTTKVVK